jgi:glycosyl hydrolase family 43
VRSEYRGEFWDRSRGSPVVPALTAWWERHHRRVLRIAVIAVALGVFVYSTTAVVIGWRALHREQATLGAARADRARTEAAIDDARAATEAELGALGTRIGERDRANDRAANAESELAAARGDLSGAEQGVGLLDTRLGAFGTCLDGVRSTLASIGGGDRPGASATLAAVSLACNLAVGAVGGGAPAFAFDFPDPFVLRTRSGYFAYSTNAGAGDIQVARSPDLRDWVFAGNALGGLPDWAGPHRTWAPSVLRRHGSFGRVYVAYYTVRNGATGPECISRAVATQPQGPFVDDSTGPMICPSSGDAIDPSPFVDHGGAAYLTWRGTGSAIWGQRLGSDGLSLEGEPAPLIAVDQRWEGDVVEGPSMVRAGGRYLLFYSANEWNSRDYTIGYAVCDSPLGPCSKPAGARLFGSFGTVVAPGGQELFTDRDGNLWMAYHAYTEPSVGYPSSRRLHLARVTVTHGVPVVSPG